MQTTVLQCRPQDGHLSRRVQMTARHQVVEKGTMMKQLRRPPPVLADRLCCTQRS
jgi:hypothetical protein